MTTQAVLLLGGRGTRLWPLTDERPKGLLPIAGHPFIELQLAMLAEAGVDDVRLAVGASHAPAWSEYLALRPDDGLRLELLVEEQPLDTAGAVAAAAADLDESFYVFNGDVLFEAEIRSLGFSDGIAALALTDVADPSRFGVVIADEDGVVQAFVEKPPPGTEPATTISVGIYRMTPEAMAGFPSGPLSFERDVFPALVERGDLDAVVVEGEFMDVGTPELFVAGSHYVGVGGFRLLDPSPHMVGDSWVSPAATVAETATLTRAVVLDGGVVGDGAFVDHSVVGWGATVEAGSSAVGYTLLGAGSRLASGTRVEGVRVGPGSALSAGSITVSPPS